jgi:hypothetical protein
MHDKARKFKVKKGETINSKVSYIPISLPLAPKKELTLVGVHGFGKEPMMLISKKQRFEAANSNNKSIPYALAYRGILSF